MKDLKHNQERSTEQEPAWSPAQDQQSQADSEFARERINPISDDEDTEDDESDEEDESGDGAAERGSGVP